MKTYNCVTSLIGNTPLLRLENLENSINAKAKLFAKLEMFNPAGSAKDRVALAMIEDLEKSGKLKKGGTIIEPTSGNTGIGLALVAAAKGYKVILTMPNTMSKERIDLLKAYGAELVLTDGSLGMDGAVKKANELLKEIDGSIIAGQFDNPENPRAHFLTTGPEIYNDLNGNIDIFVAGVGTGGTVTGVGEFLKSKNQNVQIVAVEPADSPLLSKGTAGPHKIQGIGANFVPKVLNTTIIDKIMTVTTDEAFEAARLLLKTQGVLAGISSGAALYAATQLAALKDNEGKTIVTLLPDTGEHYLSTPLFNE
ncbi:MAG: cysteine synthase A [Clostridia bacterium]|nr:cysteine synthase A [Clostridia bacterium]